MAWSSRSRSLGRTFSAVTSQTSCPPSRISFPCTITGMGLGEDSGPQPRREPEDHVRALEPDLVIPLAGMELVEPDPVVDDTTFPTRSARRSRSDGSTTTGSF